MRRSIMKSKIHRATVTAAQLHYMGSITIDRNLCEAVDLLAYEKVQVLNLDNGARLETYVILGKRGSGQIQINGAAARWFAKHDRVIIIAYAELEDHELPAFRSRVAFVDKQNRMTELKLDKVTIHAQLPPPFKAKKS